MKTTRRACAVLFALAALLGIAATAQAYPETYDAQFHITTNLGHTCVITHHAGYQRANWNSIWASATTDYPDCYWAPDGSHSQWHHLTLSYNTGLPLVSWQPVATDECGWSTPPYSCAATLRVEVPPPGDYQVNAWSSVRLSGSEVWNTPTTGSCWLSADRQSVSCLQNGYISVPAL